VLGAAKAVIVPSTGIAHLAASLGTPVIGLYSPVRVQHPRRWAARGPQVKILMPPVPNMNLITSQEVVKALQQL
ncbi:MAG: glycosyltransferase family 9 protein, partial [Bdellovibrio sp.]